MFKNVATKIALFAFDTTTGAAKTGDAANLTAYVSKDYGTVTVLGDTSATEMDATNAKGWYLFDVAQAETNADAALFTGKSSTANVAVVGQLIYTTPNRFSSLVIDSAGLADANAVKVGPSGSGTAQTARDIGASVLLSPGTGTGQLDITSGVVKANLAQILGTALTETAGQIAAGFKKFFNVPTPASTMDSLTLVATATSLTNAPTAGDFTAAMKTSLSAATPAVTVSDKTGFALTSAYDAAKTSAQAGDAMALTSGERTTMAAAVWSALTSALTTVGSIGKRLVDNIDATISSRSTYAGADTTGTTTLLSRLTATRAGNLDNVDATVSSRLAAADYVAPSGAPSAAEVAGAVWDEALSGHATTGSAGAGLTAAGSAGDPWSTSLPGAYGAGTAGKIVGDNLDAAVSTRSSHSADDVWAVTSRTLSSFGTLVADVAAAVWGAVTRTLTAGTNIVLAKGTGITGLNDLDASGVRSAIGLAAANLDTQILAVDADVLTRLATSSYVAPDNADITAIKAKTDNLPASPAATGDAMTLTGAYDFAKGTVAMTEGYATSGATMTPAQALHMLWAVLRSREIVSTTLTSRKLDGTTAAMTFTLNDPTDPTSQARAT